MIAISVNRRVVAEPGGSFLTGFNCQTLWFEGDPGPESTIAHVCVR